MAAYENLRHVEFNSNDEGNLDTVSLFEELHQAVQIKNEAELKEYIDGLKILINQFKETGQTVVIENIKWKIDCIRREIKILPEINQFILHEDLVKFCTKHSKEQSKNVLLANFEDFQRPVPADVVKKLIKVKDKFDKLYILFTDYTETHIKDAKNLSKTIEKEKDPILFGVFEAPENIKNKIPFYERFFIIASWQDEYCDLDLDKFVELYKDYYYNNPVKELDIEKDIKETAESSLETKPSFINRVKCFFGLNKNEK